MRLPLVSLLLLASACLTKLPDGPATDTSDDPPDDTSKVDTSQTDTSSVDTAPDDTSSGETATPDTSGDDTGIGDDTAPPDTGEPVDLDGDGSPAAVDCNDADASVHPGASERCNEVDDDCDGLADEGAGCLHDLDLETAVALRGMGYLEQAGFAVASAGDPTNDGVPDLLVGAWAATGDVGRTGQGEAYLVRGPVTASLDLDDAHAVIRGDAAGDEAGVSLAGVGDTSGDGVDDLLVGADFAGGTGQVGLVWGPVAGVQHLADADLVLSGVKEGELAGVTVTGTGDLDGDGLADLAVGASGHTSEGDGAVYLVHGTGSAGSASFSTAAFVAWGAAGDALGSAVAAGDVDGDGTNEIALGVPDADTWGTDAGGGYLLSGILPGSQVLAGSDLAVYGEAAGDAAGGSVALADFDGDGRADLLVGAPGAEADATLARDEGAAYVFLDASTMTSGYARSAAAADLALVGAGADDAAGCAVAFAGDLDGDGSQDLLVGAWGEDLGGVDAGAAYVLRGPLSGTLGLATADAVLWGADGGDETGVAVAGVGDLDGDGLGDLLVGAPAATGATTESGVAWFVPGILLVSP